MSLGNNLRTLINEQDMTQTIIVKKIIIKQ